MRCPSLSDLPPAPPEKSGWPWTEESPRLPISMPDCRSWPRISIVTPSYQQGPFIEETLRSVLLQGYPDIEYVVMDGGSKDESLSIIEKYSRCLTHFSSERDKGQSDALNKGFRKTTGAILGWLNSDDVLTPGTLESVAVEAAKEIQLPKLLAGTSEYRDVSGSKVIYDVSNVPSTMEELFDYAYGCYFAQPSVFFTRSAWATAGELNTDLHFTMDLEYWIRVTSIGSIHKINRKLSWMRMHEDAKTFRERKKVMAEVKEVLAKASGAVSSGVFSRAMRGCNQRLASAAAASAFGCLRSGDRVGAWRELSDAVAFDKRVMFERVFVGTLIRLLTPSAIQKLLLHNP